MTTYTLTEAQRQQLLDVSLAGVSKANTLATKMLQSLAPSTSQELAEMAVRLAVSELRANQLEAQFKSQCAITAAALDERAKMAAPSTSPLTLEQILQALVSVCDDGSAPPSIEDEEFRELIVPLARAIEATIKGGA